MDGEVKRLEIGNTERAAQLIHSLTGGDMLQIEQKSPYSKRYDECIVQSQEDQRKNLRPPLSNLPESLTLYDTVYLGYPNYWGTMPAAVFTFLESYDFSGKTIRPFCTHEGGGLGGSVEDIRRICPGAAVSEGIAIRGGSAESRKQDIEEWILHG